MCVILLHDRRNMTKDYEINQQNATCTTSSFTLTRPTVGVRGGE
jgi:hypothetical protein